jgi:hypothetical protein
MGMLPLLFSALRKQMWATRPCCCSGAMAACSTRLAKPVMVSHRSSLTGQAPHQRSHIRMERVACIARAPCSLRRALCAQLSKHQSKRAANAPPYVPFQLPRQSHLLNCPRGLVQVATVAALFPCQFSMGELALCRRGESDERPHYRYKCPYAPGFAFPARFVHSLAGRFSLKSTRQEWVCLVARPLRTPCRFGSVM